MEPRRAAHLDDRPAADRGRRARWPRSLRERLAGGAFDLVLTSPMQRARVTADLAGFGDAEVDEDLVEWGYGDYEGSTTAEIREDVPGLDDLDAPGPRRRDARPGDRAARPRRRPAPRRAASGRWCSGTATRCGR